jgi:excisionase family DNA binding protein
VSSPLDTLDTLDAAADALRGTFTTGQVARQANTTDRQVRKWVTQGRLPAVRTPGGRYRIRPEDLASLYFLVNADGGAR